MPYKTQSADTTEAFEKVQFRLLREAGPSRRLELAMAHTASTIAISRDSIAKAHPEWDKTEVALQWAASAYGEELVLRVREHLARRQIGKRA
jgi:hypothetical protein